MSAASTMAQAAQSIHASTPANGAGTPLMNLASYLLYSECALILLLSMPFYVPYRRQVLEWIHYSPRLWTVRVVIVCIHAFVAILLADTYLRLNRTTLQIEGIQAAHANALAGAAGAVPGATPGIANTVDASGHISNLNDLFSARFRGQRDFYVLAFTLFCSTVLFQLHMLLIKMDKFRSQRDDLKEKLTSRRPGSATTKHAGVAETLTSSVKNATHMVADKVDSILHPHPNVPATVAKVGVVAPAESDNITTQRVVYTTKQE
ncbi:hypothetical protein PhCBS80983_g03588 [Powellomyces hirtus]|uniref:Endoplasmic reticulum transmembrane protein n=1 Tax=Powellomyces hirtus TaxID=109895 RepID=A0A507E1W4_9FUNG|nr:B-cell receptor-associated protein 31-like-domain-containing protein [Powellomyces hirtus]TPX57771.1 hypothetical protein PhCBS80983_g03588 [Powellomyces hirtus]